MYSAESAKTISPGIPINNGNLIKFKTLGSTETFTDELAQLERQVTQAIIVQAVEAECRVF